MPSLRVAIRGTMPADVADALQRVESETTGNLVPAGRGHDVQYARRRPQHRWQLYRDPNSALRPTVSAHRSWLP